MTNTTTAPDAQKLHLVYLAVHQIRTICDLLRRRRRRPGVTARRYNATGVAIRWLAERIEGKPEISRIRLANTKKTFDALAAAVAAEGNFELCRQIVTQLAEGD